jgi:REP element-mobilizing transposase RayT
MINPRKPVPSPSPNGARSGLPLRGIQQPRRVILASHLVFHGYGHWLANDPRGSGSTELRKEDLRELGDIHFGRKRHQPSRDELRKFYREANEKLDHEPYWFRSAAIRVVADAFAQAATEHGYTVWACAVCSNHAHAVLRTHKDRAEVIWNHLATAAGQALRNRTFVDASHPVWSHRPYKVFLYAPEEIHDRIGYVEQNPGKEGLPRQYWDFVTPYHG